VADGFRGQSGHVGALVGNGGEAGGRSIDPPYFVPMKTLAHAILLAGLLGSLVGSAGAADPWSATQKIVVVLADNRFEPDHLSFRAGQAYELLLENHGKDLHEFTAPAFLRAATVRDKRLLANGGTDVVVQSGKSVSIFLIAPPKGHYDLTCADHDWDGMTGSIEVN
jgi:uncharacterized cupredoxin-like copper-binding protein